MPTYAEVLARLVTARRFGVVLGLERMRGLLDALGAPDAHLGRVIHVGGTNGKGSTVAMLAALARAAGLRVAAYTSPHLNELRERIAIDGAPIAYTAFAEAAERVSAAGGDELTFFEQVTAIACVAIAAARVDLTILEVGLGGRLDATNAIAADVAVVTGVAMDHEAILGPTLDAIAGEKAGIFKRGKRIVIGASGEPAAVPVLIAAARAVDVEPTVIDDAAIEATPPVSLIGDHQRANAAAALAALDALHAIAPDDRLVDRKMRTLALSTLTHPGRFEMIREAWLHPEPTVKVPLGPVILDGAHNAHGAAALARTLIARGIQPTLVLGVSADKDVAAIVSALLPAVGAVIATRYQQDRSMDPESLAAIVGDLSVRTRGEPTPAGARQSAPVIIITSSQITYDGNVVEPWHAGGTARDPKRPAQPSSVVAPVVVSVDAEPDLRHALFRASTIAAPILVAGSLFLVGEARALLLGVPTDPILATDPPVTR